MSLQLPGSLSIFKLRQKKSSIRFCGSRWPLARVSGLFILYNRKQDFRVSRPVYSHCSCDSSEQTRFGQRPFVSIKEKKMIPCSSVVGKSRPKTNGGSPLGQPGCASVSTSCFSSVRWNLSGWRSRNVIECNSNNMRPSVRRKKRIWHRASRPTARARAPGVQ